MSGFHSDLLFSANAELYSEEQQYFHWGKWCLHFVLLDKVTAKIDCSGFFSKMSITNMSRQVCCLVGGRHAGDCGSQHNHVFLHLYIDKPGVTLLSSEMQITGLIFPQEKHEDTVQRAV